MEYAFYENICVAWRKALIFIWGVPNITHNRVITLLSGPTPSSTQLNTSFEKFIYRAIEHSNSIINHVTKHVCRNPMYVCGRNWCDILWTIYIYTCNLCNNCLTIKVKWAISQQHDITESTYCLITMGR